MNYEIEIKLIDDQILDLENEIKILRSENLKIDLWNLIRKLNELKIRKNELMQLRNYDRYNKFSNGMKKMILRLRQKPDQKMILRLRQKPDQKSFSDPYQIRYSKQLLNLVLGAEK